MLKKILFTMCIVLVVGCSTKYVTNDADTGSVAQLNADAQNGDVNAQCVLAACYALGNCEGIPQNDYLAHEWYEKAAIQGYAPAQFIVGNKYFNGKGTQQDYTKAFKWYEKAAMQGYTAAHPMLGLMLFKGYGVRQNYAKAKEYLEKAAAQGSVGAQVFLGVIYETGKGVRQNKSIAKEWYGKACDNGDQDGCNKYRELNEAGY